MFCGKLNSANTDAFVIYLFTSSSVISKCTDTLYEKYTKQHVRFYIK